MHVCVVVWLSYDCGAYVLLVHALTTLFWVYRPPPHNSARPLPPPHILHAPHITPSPLFLLVGERVCAWVTPAPLLQHKPYFTILFIATCFVVFFGMAGQYAGAVLMTSSSAQACLQARGDPASVMGPAWLGAWITGKVCVYVCV